jgi:hypothetical protein
LHELAEIAVVFVALVRLALVRHSRTAGALPSVAVRGRIDDLARAVG